jgi:hypothetical protein
LATEMTGDLGEVAMVLALICVALVVGTAFLEEILNGIDRLVKLCGELIPWTKSDL